MSGICLCRDDHITYRYNEDRPPASIDGLSTTAPRVYESYCVDGDRLYDVFMPETRQYIGMSEAEFHAQFCVICQE